MQGPLVPVSQNRIHEAAPAAPCNHSSSCLCGSASPRHSSQGSHRTHGPLGQASLTERSLLRSLRPGGGISPPLLSVYRVGMFLIRSSTDGPSGRSHRSHCKESCHEHGVTVGVPDSGGHALQHSHVHNWGWAVGKAPDRCSHCREHEA